MRRRSLLSVVSNRWYPYSYEYLYHNLIPNEVPSFNLWDEEWELGLYSSSDGSTFASDSYIRSKSTNYIPTIGGATYYYKSPKTLRIFFYDINKNFISYVDRKDNTYQTPANASYIRFCVYDNTYGTTYNHDICINKSNSQLNGIYAPYNPHLVGKKTKLVMIDGNGEIVNQLVINGNFETDSGYSIAEPTYLGGSVSNNTLHLELLQSISLGVVFNITTETKKTNHKYLLVAKVKPSVNMTFYFGVDYSNYETFNLTANKEEIISCMLTDTNGLNSIFLRINGAYNIGTTLDMKQVMCIDLTQRYGTGREPTSVTDPRVRRIIENGYIEKNDGTYRSSVVDSLVTRGFNQWDEEMTDGFWTETGSNTNSSYIRNKNLIKVIPNETYYFKCPTTAGSLFQRFYDKDFNEVIGQAVVKNQSFVTPTNACWFGFAFQKSSYGSTYNHDICINVSSSLNGTYKPFSEPQSITLPAPVQLDGALDSHSTFEITNTEYVWTRDNWKYTFTGNESWGSSGQAYYSSLFSSLVKKPSSNTVMANIQGVLTTTTANNLYSNGNTVSGMAIESSGGNLWIGAIDYANVSSLTGKTLHYQLATPQITRIPRGRLGAYTFTGNEVWNVNGNGFSCDLTLNIEIPETTSTIPNLFCSSLIGEPSGYIYNGYRDNAIGITNQGKIIIRATANVNSVSTAQSFMAGKTIFFKTATDVPDFINQAQTEAGGTINGVEFSWVKNQLIVNGNFSDTSNWLTSNSSFSVSGGIATFTATATGGMFYSSQIHYYKHQYLAIASVKLTTANTNVYLRVQGVNRVATTSTTNWQTLSFVYTSTLENDSSIAIRDERTSGWDSVQVKDVQLIDLTLAFPDNIPTSINDPRIQYIIEHGYIPTDTTGTYENVTTQTLPNVDVMVK